MKKNKKAIISINELSKNELANVLGGGLIPKPPKFTEDTFYHTCTVNGDANDSDVKSDARLPGIQ